MTTPSPRGFPRHSGIGDVMPTEPSKTHWSWDDSAARESRRENASRGRMRSQNLKAVAVRDAMLDED